MKFIEIKTLVDITFPKVYRPGQGTLLEQKQFKNWTSLVQCIGLRGTVQQDILPVVTLESLNKAGFGIWYTGSHNVWTYKFIPDQLDSYTNDSGDILGFLKDDLHHVPIIANLTETIPLSKCCFNVHDKRSINLIVKLKDGEL